MLDIKIRKAEIKDIDNIHNILKIYANEQLLLPREKASILSNIKYFYVAELKEKFVACCATRDYDNNLFEVRSLAVCAEKKGLNIGSKLVEKIVLDLKNSNKLNKIRIFALTYSIKFFERLNFQLVKKDIFPEKIWADCKNCKKFDKCDENAMLLEV